MYTGWKTNLDTPITLAQHTHARLCVQHFSCSFYMYLRMRSFWFLSLGKKCKGDFFKTRWRMKEWVVNIQRKKGNWRKRGIKDKWKLCFVGWCVERAVGRKASLIRVLHVHLSWHFLFHQMALISQHSAALSLMVLLVGAVTVSWPRSSMEWVYIIGMFVQSWCKQKSQVFYHVRCH